ncbi:MAG: LuxR C-terminal-related transcriptional regulator [Nocardioides sp.]
MEGEYAATAGEYGATPLRAPASRGGPGLRLAAPRFDVSEAAQPALVARTAVVARLIAAAEQVVSVTAPPGYGKTTLLAEWARRHEGRVAWVSCDQVRDEPGSLWVAMSTALGSRGSLTDLSHLPGIDDHELDLVVGQRLRAKEQRARRQRVMLVLDGLEELRSPHCRRLVAGLARTVPAGWTLALASREQLPLAISRMRLERRLLEIGPDDLAMSVAEAAELLDAAGVRLSPAGAGDLVTRTEGWPAALSLAAMAIGDGEATASQPFSGHHRLMSDYLRSEVLDPLSRRERRLLVRTSVLDRVSGPLADDVVGGRKATRVLEQLARRGVALPVLGEEGWYRYHPLLRQLLETELRTETPDLVAPLHARAAEWFETHGELEQAIEHAYLSGDLEAFGSLVLEAMQAVWAGGQIDTVRRWMEQLGRCSPAPHRPAMIAHGALIFALLGRPGDAERWTAVAESLPPTGYLPDGDSVEGTLAYLRANLCRHGPATMRSDAAEALLGLGATSPYRATMVHTEGLSYLLEGDLEQADASFAHAYELAVSLQASPLTGLVLAEQFQVAAAREDWATAESLVKRALDEVAGGAYDDYWTSALVFASAARAAAHRGDTSEARRYAQRAARLRPLLTYALPVVSLQALVELARAYLSLVDPSGARAVLEQARGILLQRPDLGTLATTARELQERVDQITIATPRGASSLTAAELRLVPLLPTHLTYPEMGERLFLSRHTVKTHAASVYRKLGASSRAEAVERINQLGLR